MTAARALMVQGTSSDAGKSLLVTGLCRVLHRRGVSVAPFKPQNMSLNSAVTVDGGEAGRAQALQAQAAGVQLHSDMNPVLLKPCTDTGAQVIVHGRVVSDMAAATFQDYKQHAMAAVLESYQRLLQHHEVVIVEGAGSPAETNLRAGDIANMGFAEAADCPVILVADIDRGGVFAQLVGTLALLSASERARVCGFVINKFRGDLALLQAGLDWLENETGKPVFGVLPYLQNLQLDAEDSLPRMSPPPAAATRIRIAVLVFDRISNHTDFDALRLNPAVEFHWVGPGQPLPPADLVILPGSKNVVADLATMSRHGWVEALQRHLRYGGRVLGICGGFQMLGCVVRDPDGVESVPGDHAALGLLEFDTVLMPDKHLQRVNGDCLIGGGSVALSGYEIHCGRSDGAALARPLLRIASGDGIPARHDGAISDDGQIAGCYVHGLFDAPAVALAILRWAGADTAQAVDIDSLREQQLERLADAMQAHLDLPAMPVMAGHCP